MKEIKVFISGKVSGLLYTEAKYMFDQVEDFWRHKGFDVWNPTNHCKVTWSWLHCMIVCLWNLAKCDVAVFLDNWKDSRGARIEHKVAKLLGKAIVE